MYDVVIVGGGMAGLYTAYLLPRDWRILVLERYTLGGKVDTYSDAAMTVEAGGARFSNNHPHLLRLLRDLGLASKIKPIPSKAPTFLSARGAPTLPLPPLWAKLKKGRKSVDLTFGEYARQVLTPEEFAFFFQSFGYSSEFDIMNAVDAMRLMDEYAHDFFVLKGGLSQLVHRLVAALPHVDFVKDAATGVRHLDRHLVVSTAGKVYAGQRCVLAVPRTALEKFAVCRPLKPLLAFIRTSPLCRIYAQCPTGAFRDKVTTDNDVKMVIPITKTVVLASYTDGKYANRWKRAYDAGTREVAKKLAADLSDVGIRTPLKHLKVFYWPHGVGYWGVGARSADLERDLLHPFPDVPLYVCGENYSHAHQQWMEGALDTASKVVRLLL